MVKKHQSTIYSTGHMYIKHKITFIGILQDSLSQIRKDSAVVQRTANISEHE